ncbi:hypothetical protein [Acidithiobacillus sulfurivorans]|uniref:Uncharacterized protein n=1 Tax=Acidithiobacillus sulfurivorans TaxID=1958756 RepID=A0ABS5ZXW3_9PROT|nr:hypothetical protein [Acidithiobacillus sulfurivorans]MBU2760058.1 hypothetical protein [Acidithiobacillus sulfurivorans]
MPADIYQGRNEEHIVPATLPIELDKGLLNRSFYELEEAFEGQQGLADLVSSMAEKTASFRRLLLEEQQPLTETQMEHLVAQMFTARRKIWPLIKEQGAAKVGELMRDLLTGHGDLTQRMARFEEALPATGKVKRVIRDVAAEVLHFSDPERYPLMTRWVWDQGTTSGAIREFIRGGDYLTDFPFGESPEMFEGLRQWMRETLLELGVYRDVPYMVDIILSHQYSQYVRAMAEGFLRSDFGGQTDFTEQIRKLLGVEVQRRMGGSRLKRDDIH